MINYVSPYYTTGWLRGMWAAEVMPVQEPQYWKQHDVVHLQLCTAPENPRQAGRPKSTRIPSTGEHSTGRPRRSGTCGRCGRAGHNRATCTEYIPESSHPILDELEEDDPINSGHVPTRRKKKTCSLCGSDSHTKRRCPTYLAQP